MSIECLISCSRVILARPLFFFLVLAACFSGVAEAGGAEALGDSVGAGVAAGAGEAAGAGAAGDGVAAGAGAAGAGASLPWVGFCASATLAGMDSKKVVAKAIREGFFI